MSLISRRDHLKNIAGIALSLPFLKNVMGMGTGISTENNQPIEKFKTGIQSLDEILGGGFNSRSLNFIIGQRGTGKSKLIYKIFQTNKPKVFTTNETQRDLEFSSENPQKFANELIEIKKNIQNDTASFLSFNIRKSKNPKNISNYVIFSSVRNWLFLNAVD